MSGTTETELRPASLAAPVNEAIDTVMKAIDTVGSEHQLDASSLVFVSAQVAAQLLARNLFLADGKSSREHMKSQLMDMVGEVMDSAAMHIDQSERDLQSQIRSQIIMPN